MIEIRWHGRAGQGAKTIAELLAKSCINAGYWAQAFPEYGAERIGAPMRTFTRISKEKISTHSGIYAPDYVVVIDPTLIGLESVKEGVKEDTNIVINISKDTKIETSQWNSKNFFVLEASRIAMEKFGKNIPNIPMLGALLKLSKIISLEQLIVDLKDSFSKFSQKIIDANIDVLKIGYNETRPL